MSSVHLRFSKPNGRLSPCRQFDLQIITNIMMCCIILHNMIIEDEQGQDLEPIFDQAISRGGMRKNLTFRELNVVAQELKNLHTHCSLHNDIMDHL